VRRFVEQVRLQAHDTVVDNSVIQDILGVVDVHGMEKVGDMINHEKRLIGTNDIQKFNIQQDWHDEEEFNRGDRGELHKQLDEVNAGYRNGDQTESSGGEYGLSK
jgi:hypothetical protein